jgi:hypothetical protein
MNIQSPIGSKTEYLHSENVQRESKDSKQVFSNIGEQRPHMYVSDGLRTTWYDKYVASSISYEICSSNAIVAKQHVKVFLKYILQS